MLTDTGLMGLVYIAGGLIVAAGLYGFIRLMSDIYTAIWAVPKINKELIKIRELLEKQGR
jgi:hypothetical protein